MSSAARRKSPALTAASPALKSDSGFASGQRSVILEYCSTAETNCPLRKAI
jgi:hypothetical protein